MKTLYHISDELQALIDWEHIYKMPRCAGGHDEQLKGLFKDAKLIAHWNQGDWQGTVATCVQIPDGRFVAYNDYYGSCSGCDAWEDASDKEVHNLCINLANGAYIFKDLQDVVTFLSQDEFDSYEWGECAKPLLERIKIYGFICSLKRLGFLQRKDCNSYMFKQAPFLFEMEFSDNDTTWIKIHLWLSSKEPIYSYRVALPQIPFNVRDSIVIDYATNMFKVILKKTCDEAMAAFQEATTKASVEAIRNAIKSS